MQFNLALREMFSSIAQIQRSRERKVLSIQIKSNIFGDIILSSILYHDNCIVHSIITRKTRSRSVRDIITHTYIVENDKKSWIGGNEIIVTISFTQGPCSLTAYQG